jgi:hypothetical protein
MNRDDLVRLAQLAAMKRDIDLQHVSEILSQMNALQAEIDDLRAKARARDETVNLDPARLTGIDVVWQRWVNATITGHQSRMAELALAREVFLGRARLSFGRADVLDKLHERHKKPRLDR